MSSVQSVVYVFLTLEFLYMLVFTDWKHILTTEDNVEPTLFLSLLTVKWVFSPEIALGQEAPWWTAVVSLTMTCQMGELFKRYAWFISVSNDVSPFCVSVSIHNDVLSSGCHDIVGKRGGRLLEGYSTWTTLHEPRNGRDLPGTFGELQLRVL